ncbi:HIT family protein [Allobacillus halotolerans]|uniref:HIT family protein n=1 Tax=Allobacillus halotolerans TaxID=570278 RepID=A0ABS6GSI1_9BACI|nr:HIT family protein [Allobacillus halotolerans]MBU6081639.1 HIT family protein [Allobacillus halotolerans]
MSDCIFCKIIDGELPSAKVYEDEYVYAFMDIGQVTEGHVLLIPKKHYENIYEMDEKTASDLFKVAPKIANGIKEAFNPKGMNLVNNNGSFADQSVFHFHLHFLPRFDENDGLKVSWEQHNDDYTPEKLQQLAEKISSAL